MNYQFEICANSVESCLAAQEGGAHRVELCAGIPEGGTTPSYGEIAMARELLDIKLHVIIRPRGGDFLYTEQEIQIMERDIQMAHQLGVDGVVFGCLTPNGHIDKTKTKRLIESAQGLSVTFHRAFDVCADPYLALNDLIELGVNRILTSGQQPTALQGLSLIKELIQKANNRIITLPGSGINKSNIRQIAMESGAKEFHFSARENRNSNMIHRSTQVSMNSPGMPDEYMQSVTTAQRVRETINALEAIQW
ncbi:copper homeostasis protein CutC [Bacteroides sp. 51]|uniref:copper homeostasis protein CutC n=1 Tax=Bacteroides sp. 51 TaxID=2302938 RepID=UPI0013D3BE6B|nr:copper homeostasis protein CutC [Bacteroides sp. 51]NDV80953.1 copper homeostasis protein CutC [Bacteroides sp. 51]